MIFIMKKSYAFLLSFISIPAFADIQIFPTQNPFMNKYNNQIEVSVGQGFDTGWIIPQPVRPVPFYIGNITYSQPTTFFRVSARRSINIASTLGLHEKYGWRWQDYTIPIIYLGEDISLLKLSHFYTLIGGGIGLQSQQNARIGSKLLFQLKLSFGYMFNERWAGEFFIQHFSNANTADENHSYAFYGVGVTYNY